jgi:hypothetical protein
VNAEVPVGDENDENPRAKLVRQVAELPEAQQKVVADWLAERGWTVQALERIDPASARDLAQALLDSA